MAASIYLAIETACEIVLQKTGVSCPPESIRYQPLNHHGSWLVTFHHRYFSRIGGIPAKALEDGYLDVSVHSGDATLTIRDSMIRDSSEKQKSIDKHNSKTTAIVLAINKAHEATGKKTTPELVPSFAAKSSQNEHTWMVGFHHPNEPEKNDDAMTDGGELIFLVNIQSGDVSILFD